MIDVRKTFPRERKYACDVSACHDPGKALVFADEVAHWMTQLDSCHLINHDAIDSLEHAIVDALHHASNAVLPSREYRAYRP